LAFNGYLEILLWTVFPLRDAGYWMLLVFVNQLETKLYPHVDVNKSNIAVFENKGFYWFTRRLPIKSIRRNTETMNRLLNENN
jgi:hypothetical protein